ncbi:hypothetical protein HpMS107_01170 [Helicobacter pylori]
MNSASFATVPPQTAPDALAALWREAGMPPEALGHLTLTGADPVLPSSFAIGAAAQASLGASALAAAALWAQRTGNWQGVAVDMRHAMAEFRSERYLRVKGAPRPSYGTRSRGCTRAAMAAGSGCIRIFRITGMAC